MTRSGIDTRLRIRTNAKLNLFLRVIGSRADGYHEVETILHGIGFGDEIEFVPSQTGEVDIEVVADPSLDGVVMPRLEENLVWRAAQRLIERGAVNDGVLIRLTKRIPLAAGLGGGSGNAAGALVALTEMWAADCDRDCLQEVASEVGSDVPYCISGGTALAMARGGDLTPLPSPTEIWFVLGLSNQQILTRDAYTKWDEMPSEVQVSSAPMTLALGSGNIGEIAALLHNDLEGPAFEIAPDLRARKQALIDCGALGASMTGSGPTLFGMAIDESHAHAVAAQVKDAFDRVCVVHTQPECIERLD